MPTGRVTTLSTITIYCGGSDPDGTINGAQFDFGDGNSRIVTGEPTSSKISTTYKYAKQGTYGISCKVRDNSGAYSGIPEICRSTIPISPFSSAAISPKPTVGTTLPDIPSPTPTVAIIAFTEFTTPTPIAEPISEPIEEEIVAMEENPFQRLLLYVGGGIIVLVILFWLIRKLSGGSQNPPVIMPPTSY
jgi:hypothetical protein